MGVMRIILTTILSLLAVLLLTLTTVTYTSSALLYPEFYTSSLRESGFYETLNQKMLSTPGGEIVALPASEMETVVANILHNLLSYIRSDKDELELIINIDTSQLKKQIIDQVDDIPTCAPGEIQRLAEIGGAPSCLPNGSTPEDIARQALENQGIGDEIEIDLAQTEAFSEGSEVRGSLDSLRNVVNIFRLLFFIYVLGLAVIAFLIFITIPGSKVRILTVYGIIVLASALIIAGSGLGLQEALTSLIHAKDDVITALLQIAVSKLLSRLTYFGLAMLVVGITLTFLGIILPKGKMEEKEK